MHVYFCLFLFKSFSTQLLNMPKAKDEKTNTFEHMWLKIFNFVLFCQLRHEKQIRTCSVLPHICLLIHKPPTPLLVSTMLGAALVLLCIGPLALGIVQKSTTVLNFSQDAMMGKPLSPTQS